MTAGKTARLLCLVLALCLLCACGAPTKGLHLPERPAGANVLDVAGVLKPDTVARINAKNDALSAVGAAITVVAVDVLGSRDIAEYAEKLLEEWDLDSGRQNGVLLLLATGEEDYRLIQGSALRAELTDDVLADLAWTWLERDFANGAYDAGVAKLTDALYRWYQDRYPQELGAAQSEEEEAPAAAPETSSGGFPVWLIVLLAAAAVLLIAAVWKKKSAPASRGASSHAGPFTGKSYQGRRRKR